MTPRQCLDVFSGTRSLLNPRGVFEKERQRNDPAGNARVKRREQIIAPRTDSAPSMRKLKADNERVALKPVLRAAAN
jgi:hypothetical protein